MKRFALALILLAVAAAPSLPAAAERHSGRVVAVDPAAGTLRMEELVEGVGTETRAVERTLRLGPGAVIQLVRPAARADDAAQVDSAHWPNAWDRQPLSVAALKPGDFVTVTTSGDKVAAMDVVRP
jgi:hypothetical protein